MARFRSYEDFADTTNNSDLNSWEDSYSGKRINRIPNKTIIRTVVNYLKYGTVSKRIYI
jgi:hypothetical protein